MNGYNKDMPQWIRLDITRRYQIFFLLTAVLPIVMFGMHLLENVYFKANRNLMDLLESGLLYVEETVKANHQELAMSARQAAYLSLNDAYHQYLATGNSERFRTYLERYQQTNGFDIVLIVSPQGKILFNPRQTHPFNQHSYSTLIQESLSGKVLTGFERFYTNDKSRLNLAYVAAAPIPQSYNAPQVDGVLLIGRYVKNDKAYSSLNRVMLQHRFRVLIQEPDGYSVEVAPGDKAEDQHLTPSLMSKLEHLPKKSTRLPDAFQETIDKEAYMTGLFPLVNQHGEATGYIAISVPRPELQDFMKQNLGFILIFILVLLVWIFMAGRWFHQDVIEPMNALTGALKRLPDGDYDIRLPVAMDYHQEARETIQSFNSLVNRLGENEKLRANFISMLSHDLRTPLLAQKKVAELLQQTLNTADNPRLNELLQSLDRSNLDLLGMVDTLLETYQYEEGQITLETKPVHLKQLLQDCLNTIGPLAQEGQIQIHNEIPDDFPAFEADPVQLKRVFQNLITNAVQNMSEGCQVWVQAEALPNTIRFDIRDNGPGLSEAMQTRLFERYNSASRLTQHIGSGLGLFICKMIVELHQGSITVESKRNEGTTFHILLPKSFV